MFNRLGKAGYNTLTEYELLVHAKKIVVKERNLLVNRLKLATIVQDEDEPFYKFETRLKPIARTGKFHQKCVKCNVEVDFTEQMDLLWKPRSLGNGVSVIRKCLAMQMPSLGTNDKKVASLNKVSLKRPVGNVEVVFPMQQSVLRKTSHVIIVRRRIMFRSFVRNLKRTIIRTRAILTRKKQRLFKLLGRLVQFLLFVILENILCRQFYRYINPKVA